MSAVSGAVAETTTPRGPGQDGRRRRSGYAGRMLRQPVAVAVDGDRLGVHDQATAIALLVFDDTRRKWLQTGCNWPQAPTNRPRNMKNTAANRQTPAHR